METIAILAAVLLVVIVMAGRAQDRRAKAIAEQCEQADRQQRAWQQQIERAASARRAAVATKYADAELRRHILEGHVWTGMTREQLLDSWGEPEGRSVRVLKTKTKEILIYGARGERSQVYLEAGVVVGWRQPQ
jgi:vacuolar-type H+-ATPase subunit E/Vma4